MADHPDIDHLSERQLADSGSRFTFTNRLLRVVWQIVWATLFRTTPRPLNFWRNGLLRLFGAQVGRHVHVMPSARIWAPWNLVLHDHSSIGESVDCYCVSKVELGKHAVVSQYSFLCTASHDHTRAGLPGFDAPIRIGELAWVCADVFVAPGVTIGEGAVVGARASVFNDIEPWVVAVGNPARPTGKRTLKPL